MTNRFRIAAVLLVAIAAAGATGLWWWMRGDGAAAPATSERGPVAVLPGRFASRFSGRPIGSPIRGDERPQIAQVAIVDLDRDGMIDVLVCDALRNVVAWIRQSPRGTFTESVIAEVKAPAHVEPVDFDRDGDTDLLVAALGFLFPNNNRVGAVIVYENDGRQQFRPRPLVSDVARVADARAADLDGDGDLDVAAAGFGYDDGETSWLENLGGWKFQQHILQRLSGPINSVIADINGDARPDIVTLVSQEWEEIWAFVAEPGGTFAARMLWGSTNQDFGSSWISLSDMDRDGDPDIVYSNGDAFEYAPPNSRPWQGVQWLENKGSLQFELHRMVDLQGAASPEAADVDGDGDLDVMVVTSNADWDDPGAASLIWLENDGRMQFTPHGIATSPTHLLTLAIGDLNADGAPDVVTGGMHISRPFDRMGRVTAWTNTRGAAR